MFSRYQHGADCDSSCLIGYGVVLQRDMYLPQATWYVRGVVRPHPLHSELHSLSRSHNMPFFEDGNDIYFTRIMHAVFLHGRHPLHGIGLTVCLVINTLVNVSMCHLSCVIWAGLRTCLIVL